MAERPMEHFTVDGVNIFEVTDAKARQDVSNLKEDLYSVYVTDTASGAISSFPDGADNVPVKSLKVNIEPVQDLHGYEHPWPGGGNVNKLPPAASFETITSGNSKITPYPDGHYHLSKTAGSDSDMLTINLASPVAVSTNQYIYYISNKSSGNMIANLLGDGGTINGGYWGKPSANIASEGIATKWQFYFTAGIAGEFDFWPIISDAPVSEFTPYSNICPISGHTQAVATRCGVNLWDEEWELGTINLSNGTLVSATTQIRSKNFVKVLPNTAYYFCIENVASEDGKNGYAVCYDANGNWLGWNGSPIFYSMRNRVFTTPDNCFNIKFYLNNEYGATYNHDISINYPSTDHDYHEGHVQTYTIDLDGTRYGGTLDVTTGVLTVDRQMVDMGTLQWNAFTSSYAFTLLYAPISGLVAHSGAKGACSTYKMLVGNYTWNDLGDKQCVLYVGANEARIGVRDSSYTDATAFASAVSGQTVVYELAEPFEVTLTAQEVRTLLGTNNVFADCGDVSVEYRADTKLYIEKLTAPTEDDMIADHAISANSFFMIGNTLYRATTAIASGATITVGTNATKLSLSDALNALA